MIDKPRDTETLAIVKMQEIVDEAVDAGVDAVTIEFAKEGGLEVLFVFGTQALHRCRTGRVLDRRATGIL